MPNYGGPLGHRNTTIALTISTLVIPLCSKNVEDLAISAGCLLGLAITPDWDVNRRKVGWAGKLQFTDEYAILVPHRAAFSHMPVFGTAIRFSLAFVVPVLIVGLVFGWWVPPWIALRVFAGLCLADTLHAILDMISTGLKVSIRKGKHRGPRKQYRS